MLERENPGCFAPESTFLEPTCGDGAFVVEILRRKFERCRRRADYTSCLRSVYAMELQADNVERCIRNVEALCEGYFRPTKQEREIIRNHIIQADALKVMRMMADPALEGPLAVHSDVPAVHGGICGEAADQAVLCVQGAVECEH